MSSVSLRGCLPHETYGIECEVGHGVGDGTDCCVVVIRTGMGLVMGTGITVGARLVYVTVMEVGTNPRNGSGNEKYL